MDTTLNDSETLLMRVERAIPTLTFPNTQVKMRFTYVQFLTFDLFEWTELVTQ